MRKLKIDDYTSPFSRLRQPMKSLFKSDLFRQQYGAKHNKFYMSEQMRELCDKETWLNAGLESVVIINDTRSEVATIKDRTFVTTGLIIKELLQKNYRCSFGDSFNKYFISDKSLTPTPSLLEYADLLWFIKENSLDALEISRTSDCEPKILSNKYTNILDTFVAETKEEIKQTVFSAWEKLEKELLEEDESDTVNWATPVWQRECIATHSLTQSAEQNILEKFYRKNSYVVGDDLPPLTLNEFYESVFSHKNILGRAPSILAKHLGFINGELSLLNKVNIFSADYSFDWGLIARTEFKRDRDWHANEFNLGRSELLAIRNELEGNDNE